MRHTHLIVDLVSITAADGSPLSDKAYVHLLQELRATSVDVQHPATRAVMLDINGSNFVNKNDYYLNYVGGYMAPAP